MLTPQELRDSASFEKAVFGGYSMSAVDEFVTSTVESYSALYEENAVLKSKLDVMTDKLEEYHNQDKDMKKILIAAQKASDEMVADTERRCAALLSDAEEKLRQRNEELKRELAIEGNRVAQARKTAAAFITDVENQVRWYLMQLERIKNMNTAFQPEKKPEPAAPAPAPAERIVMPEPEPEEKEPEEETIQISGATLVFPKPSDTAEASDTIRMQIQNDLTALMNEGTPAANADNNGDTIVFPVIE